MAKGAIRVDWYPVNALAGMKFLTPVEELAYRRIIDLIYTEGGELPDDETMAEQTRTFKDWKKVRAALEKKGKIVIADGKITNEKCTEILTEIQHKSDMARLSGKASGATRRKLLPTKDERPLNERSQSDDENTPKTATDDELSQVVSKSLTTLQGASAQNGWPEENTEWVDLLLEETSCADPSRDIWPRQTVSAVLGWVTNGFELQDALNGIRAVMARPNVNPKSWAYFTEAVAQAYVNRTKVITLPTPANQQPSARPDAWATAIDNLVGEA